MWVHLLDLLNCKPVTEKSLIHKSTYCIINKGMYFFSPTSWSLPMFPVPRRSWFMVQMRPAFHHNCQYMRCVAFRSLYNYRVYRVLWCMFLFIHNEILYFVSTDTRIIEFSDVCMYIYSYTMRFCTFVITGIIEFCDVCMYIYSYTMRFCTLLVQGL